MIIGVGSLKASPGVTTVTTLVAWAWDEPHVLRVIVEADVSGGSLAARWSSAQGVTTQPGLMELATSRGDLADPFLLQSVTQELGGGLRLAAAPPLPRQVSGAVQRLGDDGARTLAEAEGVRAFVDCGRLSPGSPVMALARKAKILLLVCRPVLDEIHILASGVADLREAGCNVGLVCVGDAPYDAGDVAKAADIELLGQIPDDQRVAAAVNSRGLTTDRSFTRSALVRAVSELTAELQARFGRGVAASLVVEYQRSKPGPPLVPLGLTDSSVDRAPGGVRG